MGTNWFVEGYPSPIVIKVRLPRSVNGFRELDEVTSSLRAIDHYLFSWWYKNWNRFDRRRKREVYLLSFRLTSPPEFTILTDPAWLAVFLAILIGYKEIKSNIKEISLDANRMLESIRGLTQRELQLLHIAIDLTLQNLAERSEQEINRLSKRFEKIRKRLLGDSGESIDVDIKRPNQDAML